MSTNPLSKNRHCSGRRPMSQPRPPSRVTNSFDIMIPIQLKAEDVMPGMDDYELPDGQVVSLFRFKEARQIPTSIDREGNVIESRYFVAQSLLTFKGVRSPLLQDSPRPITVSVDAEELSRMLDRAEKMACTLRGLGYGGFGCIADYEVVADAIRRSIRSQAE